MRGWRHGREMIMNVAIWLRFHDYFSLKKKQKDTQEIRSIPTHHIDRKLKALLVKSSEKALLEKNIALSEAA